MKNRLSLLVAALVLPVVAWASTLTDIEITTRIVAKYTAEPLLSPFDIDVDTTDGVVTLTGVVETHMQRNMAIDDAREVPGVVEIYAEGLTTAESEQPLDDTWITTQVKSLIIKDDVMDGADYDFWDVSVETQDGVVFISGTVNDSDEIDEIESIARGVDGVVDVRTDLEVNAE